jgi:hypothetical protein
MTAVIKDTSCTYSTIGMNVVLHVMITRMNVDNNQMNIVNNLNSV